MNIEEYVRAARTALLLREEAFAIDMRKGFVILVCVGLLVGLVGAVRNTIERDRQGDFSQEEFEKNMRQALSFMQDMPVEGREIFEYYMKQMPVYVRLGKETEKIIPAARPYFKFVGTIISGPFGFLGFWMFYGAFVYLFSIWLGGTGSIERTFAATSLWSVAHILKVGSLVPWAGWFFSLFAWVWGILIYMKGISVSQGFDMSKSILVFLLPLAALFTLGVLTLIVFVLVVS